MSLYSLRFCHRELNILLSSYVVHQRQSVTGPISFLPCDFRKRIANPKQVIAIAVPEPYVVAVTCFESIPKNPVEPSRPVNEFAGEEEVVFSAELEELMVVLCDPMILLEEIDLPTAVRVDPVEVVLKFAALFAEVLN